jgi:serine/threonine protein kinase
MWVSVRVRVTCIMALEDSNPSSVNALSPNAPSPNAPPPNVASLNTPPLNAPQADAVTVAVAGVSASPFVAATAPIPVPDDRTVITKRPPMPLEQMPTGTLLPNPAASLTGMRLEHYELVEFVGGGGMGSVYRATDTRLGRTVAVKVLSRDQGDEETIRRFRIEAQSAARLDHPNIARVYYVGEDQGVNFIVFEFIEGVNLRDEVQVSGPIDLERALYYTLQIADALGHSSGRDVIHRDIKPSNVLLTASGQVKLVDMGLARLHQVEPSANDLTASGVMLGTFDYISPEQARDPRVADVRSDLYSLGCTLFYMLTGQPPFPEGTALQKVLRHSTDEPPDVRQFRPELGTRVAALVSKLLAKKPSQRHQSPAELIADLLQLADQFGFSSLRDVGGAVVAAAAPSHQWLGKLWQVAAAFALLVAAVAVMETIASPRRVPFDVPRVRLKEPAAGSSVEDPSGTTAATQQRMTVPAVVLTTPISKPVLPTVANNTPDPFARQNTANSTIEPLLPPSSSQAGSSSDSLRTDVTTAAPAQPTPAEAADGLKIKRIVVSPGATLQSEQQTEIVGSLGEACARAADLGLTEIELRFTGSHVEQPLEIGSSRLSIRAAPGYNPVLVFQPQVGMGSDEMIHLAGGGSAHVAFESVELRLELPADLPADGWALFSISTGQSIDLTECVLTVADGGMNQPSIHDQVAMIAVERRRAGDMMTMADPQVAMGQQARINLDRCIARGEASLVSLTDETPLTIRWNQGLLVTSQHLLETGGSATEPQYYDQIVLDLDNVTAYCREGLYYLRRGPGKAYQFHVNAYADQCIFASNPGASLFEMVGPSSPPEQDELQSTGEGNRFSPADMPFLFIRPGAGSEPQVFKLGRRWSSETRSQAGVPWLHAPALDRPLHEARKADFLIDAEPGDGRAGFDPLVLPDASME